MNVFFQNLYISLSKAIIYIIVVASISSCSSISYYSHLAQGQWSLWSQRESIDELLTRDDLDPKLKARLELVQEVREFASEKIGLADNDSYRNYTDLKRPYAVWNVFAAPEFSTTPSTWCFPFAGCVSYRGYFSEQAARDFADQLASRGMDTYVGGVAAYSTIGWFDDPVLNTFLYRTDTRLAGLIFHELAHQQVYLPGDTEFNESFARSVEITGVKQWLRSQQNASLIDGYLEKHRMQRDFVSIVLALQTNIAELYQQDLSESQMRQTKQRVFKDFQTIQYAEFKKRWNGYTGYDYWVTGKTSNKKSINNKAKHDSSNNNNSNNHNSNNHNSKNHSSTAIKKDQESTSLVQLKSDNVSHHNHIQLNNAKLSTIASYHRWLPAFEQLLEDNNYDFKLFYQQVKELSTLKSSERKEVLLQLDERANRQALLH